MRLFICLLTSLILLFSSCTIEKRAFRKGYYISWNRSVLKEKSPAKEIAEGPEEIARETPSKDTATLEEVTIQPEQTLADNKAKTDTLRLAEKPTSEQVAETSRPPVYSEEALLDRLNQAVESVKEQVKAKRQTETDDTLKRKVNLFALNAFILAIGYVILLFVAFEGGGNTVSLAIMGIVICLFAAIAFAIVGLVKWRRDRSGFWGTFFALLALILLVTGTIVFFVFAMMNTSFG